MRFQFWRRAPQPNAPPPDPIDHPAIARMSLKELADLPMWPTRPAAPSEAEVADVGRTVKRCAPISARPRR